MTLLNDLSDKYKNVHGLLHKIKADLNEFNNLLHKNDEFPIQH